jgi:acyl dehydratase
MRLPARSTRRPPTREQRGFRFAVEAGKVLEFVDALRDPQAIYRSRAAALAAGHPAIPAPLAFTRVSVFQDPDDSSVNRLLGADPATMRHAGQEWTVHAPLYAGRSYRVTPWRIVGEERKTGRTGKVLRFVTAEREYRSGSQLAIAELMRTVVLEGATGSGASAQPPASPVALQSKRDLLAPAKWRSAKPGTLLAESAVDRLRLTDFVRFAGAIGDFTPIHHDAAVARAQGLADVIAMGTLPAGLLLSLVEQGYGIGRIASVRLRFHDPLYVDRGLTLRVRAAANSRPQAPEAELEARDSYGAPILSGTAQARHA